MLCCPLLCNAGLFSFLLKDVRLLNCIIVTYHTTPTEHLQCTTQHQQNTSVPHNTYMYTEHSLPCLPRFKSRFCTFCKTLLHQQQHQCNLFWAELNDSQSLMMRILAMMHLFMRALIVMIVMSDMMVMITMMLGGRC